MDNQRTKQLPLADLAVTFTEAHLEDQARALAEKLGLALLSSDEQPPPFVLALTTHHLEIRQHGKAAPGPVFVDFTSTALDYRRRSGNARKELLARAMGIKAGTPRRVLDATAGLGRDAFILAALGCDVVMLERSPLVAALLEDGLCRAAKDPDLGPWVAERMHLYRGDLIHPPHHGEGCQVVYLDPMFPERGKKALVKKEMRLLRALVGEDLDAPQLLQAALLLTVERVVVKRPRLASAIPGPAPAFSLPGRSSRFDVYLRQKATG